MSPELRQEVVARSIWPPHGVPSGGMSRVREWSDIRRFGAGTPARLLLLAALAVAVALLAVVGHCVPLRSAAQPVHVTKPSLAPASAEIATGAHQQVLLDGKSVCKSSKLLAIAALPKPPATVLMLLGVFSAVAVVKDWLARLVVPAGRGPPRTSVVAVSGQDLLTRFCLARR